MAQISIKGLVRLFSFLLMITLASTQCPNNLAVYDPNLRTECVDGSMSPCSSPPLFEPPHTILIPSHSILHRTRRHRHSPDRRRSLQTRTATNIRQDALSERVPCRQASRARHNLPPVRHPYVGAADPDTVVWRQYLCAVCRSSRGWQDPVPVQRQGVHWRL